MSSPKEAGKNEGISDLDIITGGVDDGQLTKLIYVYHHWGAGERRWWWYLMATHYFLEIISLSIENKIPATTHKFFYIPV